MVRLKAQGRLLIACRDNKFQFLMVRLKEDILTINEMRDIIFQFLMVRLKGKVHSYCKCTP